LGSSRISCSGVPLELPDAGQRPFYFGQVLRSDANGKIAAVTDGFGCRSGFHFSHAERLRDDCRKAHYLRFRLGRTVR
jgi:hypothetical protein